MFKRLPPIVSFVYVSMMGICLGTVGGLVHEFLQTPFHATDAVVWLFLFIVSAAIIAAITLYARSLKR